VPEAIQTGRCDHRAVASTPDDVAGTEALALFDSEAPVEPAQTPTPGGTVTFGHDDLAAVVVAHGLTASDADRIWEALCERGAGRQRFDEVRVLYSVVAVIIISGVGSVMTLAWTAIGGAGVVLFAAASGLAVWFAGDSLWKRAVSTSGGLSPRFAEARRGKEGPRSDVT
jgi:hypothetical protein